MTVPAEEARITPQMLCAPVEAVGVKGGEAGALTVDGEVIEVRGCESQRSERRTLRSAIGNGANCQTARLPNSATAKHRDGQTPRPPNGATAKRRRRNDKHRSETANFGRQTS